MAGFIALEAEALLGDRPVRRYRLASGLGVILFADPSAPIVSYQTWFGVGSRHEQPGKTGIAHLFEHLLFGATETFAAGQLDRLIEESGGDTNAATWVDWTFYRCSVPATKLELCARIEADRMVRLILDEDALSREREVVIHERMQRVDDDIDGFLDENLCHLAHGAHPYGHPTIGWMDDIRAIALSDLRAFYRRYYAPNNATVVIAGDIDPARALDLVALLYADIPPSRIPGEDPAPPSEPSDPPQLTFARPIQAPRMAAGYLGVGQDHPDWPVLEVIAAILCGSPSSRLYRDAVVDRELCSGIMSGIAPFRDPALFRVDANLRRGVNVQSVLDVIDEHAERLARAPVDAAELDKVKSVLETNFWLELSSLDGKAEALGHFETTLGDFQRLWTVAERIGAVTSDDVMRAAGRYLVPANRRAAIAVPEAAS